MVEPAADVKRAETQRQETPTTRAQKGEPPARTWTWANEGLTAILEPPDSRPTAAEPPELTPALILELQRTSGNAAVEELLHRRRRPQVQRCPDHSCGVNCSHTVEQGPAETRPDANAPPVQRYSLLDAIPAGVALLERGLEEKPKPEAKDIAPPAKLANAPAPSLAPNGTKAKENRPAEGEARSDVPATTGAEVGLTIAPVKADAALAGAAPLDKPATPPADKPVPPPDNRPVPPSPSANGSPAAAPAGAPSAPAAPNGHGGTALQLLQSLASVPVSSLAQVLGHTAEAANVAHAQEVASLAGSLPKILQPTGLPAIAERKPTPPTALPEGQAPEPPSPTLPTRGKEIEPEAAPKVELTGEADPALNASYRGETDHAVATKQADAESAVHADFGETDVYPTVHPEMLQPATKPKAPVQVPPSAAPIPVPIPNDARAEFDQESAPWLKEQIAQEVTERRKQEETYAKTSREVKEAGQREIAEETGKARAEQKRVQEQARAGVETERAQWREENRKISESYQQQGASKRREVDQQITDQVQTADRDAQEKMTDAQARAEQERKAAEAKAAQAKKDADRPQSWWDKAKGAVSSAFDAIKGAVAGIFDALRRVVKEIIDIAKQAAHAIIDAARTVVVGLIKGFGVFLKGLVTVALLAFPSVAAKIRARIDSLVNAAADVVNRIADDLKKRADAILDRVGAGVDTALRVLQAGFTAILSGLEKLATLPFDAIGALARFIEMVKPWMSLLEGEKKLEEAAASVIEAIKTQLGEMIAQVPAKVDEAVQFAVDNVGGPAKKHLEGIWRHLKKGLAYLKDNWWTEVKKTAWNLVWPWPAVWKDLKQIWTEIKAAKAEVGKFEISKAIDHGLKIVQTLNGIAGNLYGWFFIGSVLVGTIVGAFFGGAGAIPGALAGMAFAAQAGEVLLASLIATETAVILKGVWDLAFGSGKEKENEDAYERIAGSGLTLGITGAMMILGEIAADIAKSVFDAVVDLLKGEKPAVEVPIESGAKAEAAPGEGSGETKLPAPEDQKVLAEQPTLDGEHEIKVTEDGTCLICSTCEEVRIEYADELKENPELDAKLKEANAEPDAARKAQKVQEIEQELSKARQAKAGDKPTVRPEEQKSRTIRLDDDFTALKNTRGHLKSHLDANGSLIPANPTGDCTPLEHIYGMEPAKGNSPYSSFLSEGEGGVAKSYGQMEIEVDIARLKADIEAGKLPGVEVLPPEELQGMITREIQAIEKQTGVKIDIEAALENGPEGVADYLSGIDNLSRGMAGKLERRLVALSNTLRDGEFLIKGVIPAEYLTSPKLRVPVP